MASVLFLVIMLRWLLLLSPFVLACSSGSGVGNCGYPTRCVSRELAWCGALGHAGVDLVDAEALDGGLSCQFLGQGGAIFVPYDAGDSVGCPTTEQLGGFLNGEYVYGNDAGTQQGDQCCYLVGSGGGESVC